MEPYESKLIPILREGIEVIKMIFFKKLREKLAEKHAYRDPQHIGRLAGAIVNDLFGTSNTEEPYASFVEENQFFIRQEMDRLSTELPELRIPLTDALRIQFLCDSQEGIDSTQTLARAGQLGVLILDREVPLPARFLALVRKLGNSFDLLVPGSR